MRKQNKKLQNLFLKEFGENIKKIRQSKNLTQLDLAMRINGDAGKISKIERGVYNLKVSSLLVLAQALSVDIKELLDIKDLDFFKNNILEHID